jgi:pyrimidine operon attenuation protein / uracil phosphoribosyltransferase
MGQDRILVVNKELIALKLQRMAYEIWEQNSDETEITLIGIEAAGRIVADNLSGILREISPLTVHVFSVNINKRNPLNHALDFEENLTGRSVVVVDDVINSGKTIMYSLHALLSYDMRKVMVAALVDRKHKSFPIAPDITGHTIATTLQNHIAVETEGTEVTGIFLEG